MKYVALLRGINVGGRNKVEMPKLKRMFERVGCENVETYINTGNIIFDSSVPSDTVTELLEQAIKGDFGLSVRVLLRDKKRYMAMMADVPKEWANNKEMKSDVLFLWDEIDIPDALESVPIVQGVDTVRYSNGALLWSVGRSSHAKSAQLKLAGTKLYKQMTIRNVNTARAIAELIEK